MSLYPKEQKGPDGSRYPGLHPDTGEFTSGDASRGIPASALPAETINLILNNLQGVIARGLEESNPSDGDQLLRGLQAIIRQQVKDSLAEGAFCPIPVGGVFIQYPEQEGPFTLWPHTEWENISPLYKGAFFRIEGGLAQDFANQEQPQGDAIRNITGSITSNRGVFQRGEGALQDARQSSVDVWGGSSRGYRYRILADFDASRVVPTAEENRPLNYTARIFKRIA